jgi:lipoprotein-anchoring transpeptidase ErfK/SrfK
MDSPCLLEICLNFIDMKNIILKVFPVKNLTLLKIRICSRLFGIRPSKCKNSGGGTVKKQLFGIKVFLTFILLSASALAQDFKFNDIVPQEEELFSDQANETWDFYDSARVLGDAQAQALKRRVQIVVTKSMLERGYQFLETYVDGQLMHRFTVSTAWERTAEGKSGRIFNASTPAGVFTPDSFEPKRYSMLWKVWLKYVIRFNSGIWIHATSPDHYHELGAPASSGCVRLHEEDAKTLFNLVTQFGMKEVAITVKPAAPGEKQVMPKKAPGRQIEIIEQEI